MLEDDAAAFMNPNWRFVAVPPLQRRFRAVTGHLKIEPVFKSTSTAVLDCELAGSLKLKRAYALETESRKVSKLA